MDVVSRASELVLKALPEAAHFYLFFQGRKGFVSNKNSTLVTGGTHLYLNVQQILLNGAFDYSVIGAIPYLLQGYDIMVNNGTRDIGIVSSGTIDATGKASGVIIATAGNFPITNLSGSQAFILKLNINANTVASAQLVVVQQTAGIGTGTITLNVGSVASGGTVGYTIVGANSGFQYFVQPSNSTNTQLYGQVANGIIDSSGRASGTFTASWGRGNFLIWLIISSQAVGQGAPLTIV